MINLFILLVSSSTISVCLTERLSKLILHSPPCIASILTGQIAFLLNIALFQKTFSESKTIYKKSCLNVFWIWEFHKKQSNDEGVAKIAGSARMDGVRPLLKWDFYSTKKAAVPNTPNKSGTLSWWDSCTCLQYSNTVWMWQLSHISRIT